MAEETFGDSLLDLKEVEMKVGRKTPDCLLTWMKDDHSCQDYWRAEGKDDLSDKLYNLKQDMRWLRSTDVGILRQLVAIHEGIEAVRWLMEERGPLASHGSSLTGSLSSLVTVEEPGASASPCRESPSLTFIQDVTEEDSRDQLTSDGCSHEPEKTKLHPSITLTNPEGITDPIQEALLRSFRGSRSAGETSALQPEGGEPPDCMKEDFGSFRKEELLLLGYDARWCWVESEDDVTYL